MCKFNIYFFCFLALAAKSIFSDESPCIPILELIQSEGLFWRVVPNEQASQLSRDSSIKLSDEARSKLGISTQHVVTPSVFTPLLKAIDNHNSAIRRIPWALKKLTFPKEDLPSERTQEHIHGIVKAGIPIHVLDYLKSLPHPSFQEHPDIEISKILQKLKDQKPLNSGEVSKLESLGERAQDLEKQSMQLKSLGENQGALDKMVYDFLLANMNKIESDFKNLDKNQRIVIPLPIDDNGNLRLDNRKLRDFEGFTNLVEEYKEKVHSWEKIHKALTQHAIDYRVLKFHAAKLFDAKYTNQSADVSTRIKAIKTALSSKLSETNPIHPSQRYMRIAAWKMDTSQLATKVFKKYKTGIALLSLGTPAYLLIKNSLDKQEQLQDESNALNEEYWIKKCSQKGKSEVTKCLFLYADVLGKHFEEIINAKKLKDPLYNGSIEFKATAKLMNKVVNASFQGSKFQVVSQSLMTMFIEYALQSTYNYYKTSDPGILPAQDNPFMADDAKSQTKSDSPAVDIVAELTSQSKSFQTIKTRFDAIEKTFKAGNTEDLFKQQAAYEEHIQELNSIGIKNLIVSIDGDDSLEPLRQGMIKQIEERIQKMMDKKAALMEKILMLEPDSSPDSTPAKTAPAK
jgi:hypothetical protein